MFALRLCFVYVIVEVSNNKNVLIFSKAYSAFALGCWISYGGKMNAFLCCIPAVSISQSSGVMNQLGLLYLHIEQNCHG